MDNLKQRYGTFGPSVVEQIRLELNRTGSLKDLLIKLDAEAPDDLEQQHVALYNLIGRFGPLFFMTVAKSDWTSEQVTKMKKNLKSGVDTPIPGKGQRLTRRSITPAPGPRLGVPQPPDPFKNEADSLPPRRRVPLPQAHPGQKPVQMRSPYSAPSKGGSSYDPSGTAGGGSAPMPTVGPAGYVNVPAYQGPDRRVRGERRAGPADRRAGLKVVYKNNRFGGKDRRKMVRRAADRASGSRG